MSPFEAKSMLNTHVVLRNDAMKPHVAMHAVSDFPRRVLLCHNFYQEPGGEDQVFADEGLLLESHGHEVIRYTRHNDDIAKHGPLADRPGNFL